MSISIINNYELNASIFLDSRRSIASLNDLKRISQAQDILYPHGFEVFCVQEGSYYVNVSPQGKVPEWKLRLINDEEPSFVSTYSSQKISELLQNAGGDDTNIGINDNEPSPVRVYSSQKVESIFAELRQETTRVDDDLLDIDARVEYLEGEMWKLYGFDGSYDSLTNKPSLENYATKEYVDEAVANNDGGSGLPLLSSICMKNEDGSLVVTSGVRPMDFELIPKDETVAYLDDITNTSVLNNAYLGLYKDGELTNVTLRLSSVFPIVNIGYRTNTQQLVFGNTFNTILCDLTNGTRTTQNSYSLSAKANSSDILTKTNTTEYTPTENYHPATKKYVDDAIIQSAVGGDVDLSGYATKEYVDEKVAQSDWDVTDPESSSYVKNRTHGEFDDAWVVYADDKFNITQSVNEYGYDNGSIWDYVDTSTLKHGEIMRVTFEGQQYECAVRKFNNNFYFGKGSAVGYRGFEGENLTGIDDDVPFFCMLHTVGTSTDRCKIRIYVQPHKLYYQYSFKLERKGKGVVKLDEKYLPELIGKRGYLVGAETFNHKYNEARGEYSHAEGQYTCAYGYYSHAEGQGHGMPANDIDLYVLSEEEIIQYDNDTLIALGEASHAEGLNNIAMGNYSHAEGDSTIAKGSSSHSEGISTRAMGDYSHAEGYGTIASGYASHAEGYETTASEYDSHAEGYGTIASAYDSHAEGNGTTASGEGSHAEGYKTEASGNYSHSEGDTTTASGNSSHSEGYHTKANGHYSHAEGYYTIASSRYQHVQGQYNIEDSANTYVHIVGNGDENTRSNAHTLDWDGNAWYAGNVTIGTDNKKLATEDYVDDNKFSGDYNDLENKPTMVVSDELQLIKAFTAEEISAGQYENEYSVGYSLVFDNDLIGLELDEYYTIAYGDEQIVHIETYDYNLDGIVKWITTGIGDASIDIFDNGYINAIEATENVEEGKSSVTIRYRKSDYPILPEVKDFKIYKHVSKKLNSFYLENDVNIVNSLFIGDYKRSEYTSYGNKSLTIGENSEAKGDYSVASGIYARATGKASHAEGENTEAVGEASHIEGISTMNASAFGITASTSNDSIKQKWSSSKFSLAKGQSSHVEGENNLALGNYSHAEGKNTIASGENSHAEGLSVEASGNYSHAEGGWTTASGNYSHAEGYHTIASSESQHVQGQYNIEDSANTYVHIVGNGTDDDDRSNAHTLDWDGNAWFAGNVTIGADNKELATKEYVDEAVANGGDVDLSSYAPIDSPNFTTAISMGRDERSTVGEKSVAVGHMVISDGWCSFAEGVATEAKGEGSHAEGTGTKALGKYSHAEGDHTEAIRESAHAEGANSVADGYSSHAEGYMTTAIGESSHAEGANTVAIGYSSHAEGYSYSKANNVINTLSSDTDNDVIITAWESDKFSLAKGEASHVEGKDSLGLGEYSHAEGCETIASGIDSHAEGASTIASGNASHSEGGGTIASGECQHVQGKWNIEDTTNTYAHIVGNGDENTRSNAHTLDWDGNAWYKGNVTVDGTPTADNNLVTKKYVDEAVANNGGNVDLSDYATKEQVDTLARVLCDGGNILNLDLTMEEIGEIFSLEDNSYITLPSISASIISEVVNGENPCSRVSLSNLIGFEISSTGGLWEDFIDCADAIRCRLVRNEFDSPNTIYPDLPEKSHCTTYVENYFVGVKYGTEEVVFGKTYMYEYNHVTKKYVDDAVANVQSGGGSGNIDLSDYATKEYVDEAINGVDVTEQLTDYAKTEDIPTKTSELTNDSGFLTEHQDISHLANKSDVPTKVSQLTNDKGYLTEHQSLEGLASETYVDNKVSNLVNSAPETLDTLNELAQALGDDPNFATTVSTQIGKKVDKVEGKSLVDDDEIERLANVNNYDDTEVRGLINAKANPSDIPTKVSQLTNDSGFLTSVPSEYVTDSELNAKGYLTQHQSLEDYAKKSELHSHSNKSVLDNITSDKVAEWDNKSTFSGNYNDLTNKPTIPSTEGLATEEYVNNNKFSGDYNDLTNKPTIPSTEGLATEGYVNNMLSGLRLIQMTQSEYDALEVKDSNTLYIII